MPLSRPLTTQDVVGVEQVAPPGETLTTYPVTGDPPSSVGGDQAKEASPLPAVPVRSVGAPGTVAGSAGVTVTGADAKPSPSAFEATTVTVYSVPLVSPVRTQLVAPKVLHDAPPGEAVAVYPVTVDPPSSAGADHDTLAMPLPGVADAPVGAPGTVTVACGVTLSVTDAGPSPSAFVATTVMS